MGLKDANWVTVGTVTTGNLSNTFGSSTQTDTFQLAEGVTHVKFRLSSRTLGTASAIRVTPAFEALDGTTTYPHKRNGDPVYWELRNTDEETPPFKIDGRYKVGAETWCDVAAGATGAAVVQMIRVKSKHG